MQKNVPDMFQAGGLQPTPFANSSGPLSSPGAFIQHVFPMFGPHIQALVDTGVQAAGTLAVPKAPYTVGERAPEVKGNNYTAFLAQMDNRPVMVFRRNDGNEHYVVPMERFINPANWFAPLGQRSMSAQAQQQAPTPQQQQSPAPQQQQQQQQPTNLFEYMSKLPPNERMLYTLLIYMLLSDAISSVFRRGGQARSAPQQVNTGWMPGPPRGSQWMIWG
jgi:hypothetical protein